MDVDLGLGIVVLGQQRYRAICERLRNAGFRPDVNEEGHQTSQRWQVDSNDQTVLVDFLIPPTQDDDRGGRLRNLESDFAAIITPGLDLAFRDRQQVTLEGRTIRGEQAMRKVWVCGAGAFVVLKALAFDKRGENKDAYDLVYLLQNYGDDVVEVVNRLHPLLDQQTAQDAVAILDRDFTSVDSVGAIRVATFLGNPDDVTIRADAAGSVRALLEMCHKPEDSEER